MPHLKKSKKAKPPIRFNNLYTIQPDDLKKQAKNTFFGVELPPEEMEPVEKPETPIEGDESEEEEEEEDEDQAKFFITEDEKKRNGKKKAKSQKRYNQDENQIDEGERENTEEYKDYSEPASSENKELYSATGGEEYEEEEQEEDINLEGVKNLDDFKKVANMLIGGDSKDYDQPVEINTAYKLLRQVMKKSTVDKTLESQLSKASKKNSSDRCKRSFC